jgi:two-component system, sensor histidine kinase and response regulator
MLPGQFNSATVNRLRLLWPQLADMVGDNAVMLASEMLAWPVGTSCLLATLECHDFLLLLSPNFSACLGIQTIPNSEDYYLSLVFATDELGSFLLAVYKTLPVKNVWRPILKKWYYQLQPNDSYWQSQFTLQLINAFSLPALLPIQPENQKETLEQQVDKRTSELRDALIVAQAASAAKTEFLAVLSHELRTPLTSILGLSYTLLNLLNSNLDTRQKSYIQTIKNSGDHLLELIDDMLEMSKLEAGRAVLKISEFSLLKLLQQVVQMVQQRADLRSISLQIQIMDGAEDITQDHNQDVRFRGDTKRIKQILINLLTNAIKFTEESGSIIIRTWREFDYLVLQVEDTGIGIAQDQIPRIFQKFQQLDSTLDRAYEGIGLGLALTKQLVELHGGWIEVESVENDGSTFTVWLASQSIRLPKAEKIPSLNQNDDDQQPTKTIVLVEKDSGADGLVADILTAAGYQVVSLTETYLAHKQIELWQPDLVIIDQEIGQDPTSQILNYLHNLTETQHIRYLLISTPDQQNSKEQAMAVDRLFWNRVQPEQLLAKIAQII